MATQMRKVGKCSNCCPDGGAIFKKEMGDDGAWQWKCQNCWMVVMCQKRTGVAKVTPSQKKVVDRVTRMGWVVTESKLIGRKLFVVFEHPTRNWMLGNSTFGTIGPKGSFSFDWSPVMGTKKKLTDDIDLDVYMR